MRAISIQSCCAGSQFVDFPGAHHVPPQSEKLTTIQLLNLMYTNRHLRFLHGFVNDNQNILMSKVFKLLGWDRHPCGRGITTYIHTDPSGWFKANGLWTMNSILLPDIPSHYKLNNDEARKQWTNAEPLRADIIKELSKFDVSLSDIESLKPFMPPPVPVPAPKKPKHVRKPRLAPTATTVEEDGPRAGTITYTTIGPATTFSTRVADRFKFIKG